MSRHPCGICTKGVRTGGILCTSCNKWIHLNCMNLAYSEVKNFTEEEMKTWKCANCSIIATESGNCYSLAQEIDSALVKENEDLRQELHEVKNRSSFFELQLEDDLKQKEEELDTIKKLHETRENELEEKINLLERRIERIKEINETIIKQAEEEKLTLKNQNNKSVNVHCNECMIRREEMKNMLSSIRTLETVISILTKENNELQRSMENSKSNCITCFPPLYHTKQSGVNITSDEIPKWKEVQQHNSKSKLKMLTSTPAIALKNRFNVFSDCISEEDDEVTEVDTEEGPKNLVNVLKTKMTVFRKCINSQDSIENRTKPVRSLKKRKMLLCTDSHGRDLAFHLNNITNRFDAMGFVKPGGCANHILTEDIIEGEKLKKGDVLLIMAGSNDVARNEAQTALNKISDIIKKYQHQEIILVDLPKRHDLANWSCVNLEIRRTNRVLKELSYKCSNVSLVEVSLAVRDLHTRHGQHLNRMGKSWLADKIYKAASHNLLETERTPSTDPEDNKRTPEVMIPAPEKISSRETNSISGATSEEEIEASTPQGNDQQLTTPVSLAQVALD